MKKLLLISALIVPTMASASDHCNAVSDFAVTVMDSKNANVSKYRLMSSLFEVKPHKEYGWYRWTGRSWEHYCWYQEVKPL